MSELEQQIEQEEPEETTRDALEAAFEQHEDADESEVQTPDEPSSVQTPAEQTPAEPALETAEEKAPEELKAPASWSPVSRETWKDIPETAKKEIAKREQQTSQAMTESAQARRFSNSFGDMAQRYTGFISANSGNPLQEVESLLQTASVMQSGTATQKAQMAADLITRFGVDISTLDSVLVGEQTQSNVPEEVQQRLNQLEGILGQQQQQQQVYNQQEQDKIKGETKTFLANNEFAEDLKMTMADFMDIAENQGYKISLEEAYQRAMATRPDIQQLIANRTSSQNNQQALQASRKAGVSVPQSGGPSGAPKEPSTIREALMNAWEG